MTNQDIIKLGNGGFLAATGHSLPVEHFYKFVKWKRAVQKAYDAAGKAQGDFLAEVGLTVADLQPDAKPDNEKKARYNSLNQKMLDEDVEMPAVKIPLEYYKGLYDENNTDRGDIFANLDVETVLLDNLFTEEQE